MKQNIGKPDDMVPSSIFLPSDPKPLSKAPPPEREREREDKKLRKLHRKRPQNLVKLVNILIGVLDLISQSPTRCNDMGNLQAMEKREGT